MTEYLRGFVTALHTITIIPIRGKDTSDYSKSLYSFPLVGALLGGLIYFPLYLYQEYIGTLPIDISAFIILAFSIFITRGFHLDGVADWADGFWGGHDKERILAIMKDSLLGTFGVLALVSLLLFKWLLFKKLIEGNLLQFLFASFIISRTCQVEIAAAYPYARSEGTALGIVKGSNWTHRVVAIVLGAGLLFPLFRYFGPLLLFLGIGFTHLFGAWCLKKVDGVTGDLIGACSELTEVVILSAILGFSAFTPTLFFN